MRKTGEYKLSGSIKHFVPDPLPPQQPPFTMTPEITALYGEVMLILGKLNEIARKLPDVHRFIKAYVIKEALLSSAIEGIHTTLLEVFTQPLLDTKPNKETQLVMNYTKALDVSLEMIKNQNMPISSRVLLQAHLALMQEGENDKADPGNYRKQGVRVGQLIPPPAQDITQLMSDLETYINTDTTLPPLINAGLAHVQFETIHPFLDGNGRIGRLLIILMLIEQNLLIEPILYPSYYFKKYQAEYYRQLDRVRIEGDFEGWIRFYLTVMKSSGLDAYQRAQDIEALSLALQQQLTNTTDSSRKAEGALRALTILFATPIINIKELSIQLGTSYNTANRVVTEFLELGILIELSEQKRGKLFKFKPYFDILEKEYSL